MSTDSTAAPVSNGAPAAPSAAVSDAMAIDPSPSAPVASSASASAGTSAEANGLSSAVPKRTGPKVNPSGKGKRKRNRRPLPDPYSPADVLFHDVVDFLGPEYVKSVLERGDESEWSAPEGLERFSEVELRVGAMTVSGESIISRRCLVVGIVGSPLNSLLPDTLRFGWAQ